MAEGVRALQAAEVIGGRTFWKAIWVTGRDIEGIQHPQPVFQVRDSVGQICRNSRWQLTERTAKAMAPALLSLLQVDGLQGFFNGLMTGETSPLMVTGLGAQLGLSQISGCLVKPVLGAVHLLILKPLRLPTSSPAALPGLPLPPGRARTTPQTAASAAAA